MTACRPSIIGLAVVFDRPCDRVNLCCTKNRLGKIAPGIGSQGANLVCSNCGAHRGYLSQEIATQISDIVSKFGPLDAPIILRAGGKNEQA
jgi:hypothetical protein